MVRSNQQGLSQTAWIIIGVVAIALIALAIPLFTSEDTRTELGLDATPTTPIGVEPTPDIAAEIENEATIQGETTLAAVLNNPEIYAGQQVMVRGELGEWLSAQAFTLESPSFLGSDLLVVGATIPQPADEGLLNDPDLLVEAQGVVRIVDVNDAQTLENYNLGEAELADWDGRPVLVATIAQVVQE